MAKKAFLTVYLVGVLLILANPVWSIPRTINFQGQLADSQGNLLDGMFMINFYLFNQETGGTEIWSEQQTIEAVEGIFNAQLGAVTPLDSALFDSDNIYLEMEIFNSGTGWETMAPRRKLTSTAFAMKAANAENADNAGMLANRTLADLDASYVNIGETDVVNAAMIADGSIGADDLGIDSVGEPEISTNAVGSNEIADGSIAAVDLADDYVNVTGDAMVGEANGWVLGVINNSPDPGSAAIYASGTGLGLYAEQTGGSDVGILTPDFIQARGFRSTEVSCMWFPGTLAVLQDTSDSEIEFMFNGVAKIRRTVNSTGYVNVYIPLSLPGNLFGQNVKIQEVQIYYQCSTGDSYISTTSLSKIVGTLLGGATVLASDATDYKNTTGSAYSLDIDPQKQELDVVSGILNLSIGMFFVDDVDLVSIGGVRVKLSHR